MYSEAWRLRIKRDRASNGGQDVGAATVVRSRCALVDFAYLMRVLEADARSQGPGAESASSTFRMPPGRPRAWSRPRTPHIACVDVVRRLTVGKIMKPSEAKKNLAGHWGCGLLFSAALRQWARRSVSSRPTPDIAPDKKCVRPAKRERRPRPSFAHWCRRPPAVPATAPAESCARPYELLGYDDLLRIATEEGRDQPRAAGGCRPMRVDSEELYHNLAVIDLTLGKAGTAEKVFDALAGKRPPPRPVEPRDHQGPAGRRKAALQLTSARRIAEPALA